MRFVLSCLALVIGLAAPAGAQEAPARFLFIGAHPDDADLKGGGTAAHLVAHGHAVKFLSVTSGDAGHWEQGGGQLARRRAAEAQEAARRLGIEYEVLPFHDGELLPTLEARHALIRAIRAWNADVVVGHRPNDYHPDHRYTGVLMQDAAILVQVPNVLPNTPPTTNNPVFLYFEDDFRKPTPFTPDVAIDTDPVFDRKMYAMSAHVSQFDEYLVHFNPDMGEVPADSAAHLEWMKNNWTFPVKPEVRAALAKWYGQAHAAQVQTAEAFEIAEYGTQPDEATIRRLFSLE